VAAITESELLRAIEAALERQPDGAGMTTAEIVDASGLSKRRVLGALRSLKRAERLVVGRAYRRNLADVLVTVPVHQLVPVDDNAAD